MQRWRGVQEAPGGWGRCVVTIGVFDGVHRGHQAIIGRTVERARDTGLPAVVLTFDPHPAEVVRPGSHPAVLTGPRRKAELIESLGVDVLCVLPFTLEFSRLGAAEFVHQVLVEHLHTAAVVVGENFRFGHKAAGDV
ncbi:MAG: bifunctional riboflavin kinase/FAD synthetase, partial [bacterium]